MLVAWFVLLLSIFNPCSTFHGTIAELTGRINAERAVGKNSVGCLLIDICESHQTCVDDNSIGRCIPSENLKFASIERTAPSASSFSSDFPNDELDTQKLLCLLRISILGADQSDEILRNKLLEECHLDSEALNHLRDSELFQHVNSQGSDDVLPDISIDKTQNYYRWWPSNTRQYVAHAQGDKGMNVPETLLNSEQEPTQWYGIDRNLGNHNPLTGRDSEKKSIDYKIRNRWAYPSINQPSQLPLSSERLSSPMSSTHIPEWEKDGKMRGIANKRDGVHSLESVPLRRSKYIRSLGSKDYSAGEFEFKKTASTHRLQKRNFSTKYTIHPATITSLAILLGAILLIVLGTTIFFIQYTHRNATTRSSYHAVGGRETAGKKPSLLQNLDPRRWASKCRQNTDVEQKGSVQGEDTVIPKSSQQSRRSTASVISSGKDRKEVIRAEQRQSTSSERSSVSSWSSEPINCGIDLTTGHLILSYMEGYLRDENRLSTDWESVNAYEAEQATPCEEALFEVNQCKNRKGAPVPFQQSRVRLRDNQNDYINASLIFDNNPRNPNYIAAPSPMLSTLSDFWRMVWEQTSVVIVCLESLDEVKQPQNTSPAEEYCDLSMQYWPNEGVQIIGTFEIHLVSEHNWCEDYVVRSLYLKNLQTNETRTVTQFHFLTWNDQQMRSKAKSVLDFRRKVNRSFRGMMSPILVHCRDGASRTGTYILLDLVLNRICKGVKEINIAASLEHLRDQRPGMVKTKEQYEFVFTAIAQEVDAMLKTTGSSN